MLHDIIVARNAIAVVLLCATAIDGAALRSSSLQSPPAFGLPRTFRMARPAACPSAADTGPEITTRSTATVRHTAPSTHTFPARPTYVMLAHPVTGSVVFRTTGVPDRLGTPQQHDCSFATTNRFGMPSLGEIAQRGPGSTAVGYAGALLQQTVRPSGGVRTTAGANSDGDLANRAEGNRVAEVASKGTPQCPIYPGAAFRPARAQLKGCR